MVVTGTSAYGALAKCQALPRELLSLFKSLSRVCHFCYSMDWNPPGSSVHGILQARILEWVAISSSRGYSPPRE